MNLSELLEESAAYLREIRNTLNKNGIPISNTAGLQEIVVKLNYISVLMPGTTGGLDYVLTNNGSYYTVFGIGSATDKELYIPSLYKGLNVKDIGETAFRYNNNITSVFIPYGIESIENLSFYKCESLKNISIGESIKTIGEAAFAGCNHLTSIHFNAIDMDNLSNDNRVFEDAGKDSEGITVTIGKNVLRIPDKLFRPVRYLSGDEPKIVKVEFESESLCREIGQYSFSKCPHLTSVNIPSSVTLISGYAFEQCSSLSEITLPNSIGLIAAYAFQYCSALTNVVLPNTIPRIMQYTFYSCSNLKSITIPKTVKVIFESAFDGCESLTDVYYEGTEEEWNSIVIHENNTYLTNATIHYNSTVE